jgi:hypothetical protein
MDVVIIGVIVVNAIHVIVSIVRTQARRCRYVSPQWKVVVVVNAINVIGVVVVVAGS